MSWHYQIRQRTDRGKTWYDIVEVYESPRGWTYDGIAHTSDTLEGMMRALQNMNDDIRTYKFLIKQE